MSYANVHSKYHDDGGSDKFSQNAFGVGYKHNLSKRTSVYAQAYFVDADDLAFMNFKQQSGRQNSAKTVTKLVCVTPSNLT